MKVKPYVLGILLALTAFACKDKVESTSTLRRMNAEGGDSGLQASEVTLVNGTLHVKGTNLDKVVSVTLQSGDKAGALLQVIEKSATEIALGAADASLSVAVGVSQLLIATADGTTVQPIVVSLEKGAIDIKTLSSLGASDGQILAWDAENNAWHAIDLSVSAGGLTYKGKFSPASGNMPDGAVNGDFYIASDSGTTKDTKQWREGDWALFNGDGNRWDKLAGINYVSSVHGRRGDVVAAKGDYKLAQMGDVTIDMDKTPPKTGDVLTWDGKTWKSAAPSGGSSPLVLSAADIPSLDAGKLTSGTLAVARGGTGLSAATAGGIAYGSSASALAMTSAGTSGQVLTSNGAGAPTWSSLPAAVTASTISGTLDITKGGTGLATIGGNGTVLTSNGASASWSLPAAVNLATGTTGTLAVASGGTGATTLAANAVLLGNATSALQTVAPGSAANYLRSNGTTWAASALQSADITGALTYTPVNKAGDTMSGILKVNAFVSVGSSGTPAEALDVTGNIKVSGSITEDAWTTATIIAPWVQFEASNGTYFNVAYQKDKEGYVHLRGLATTASSCTSTVFTLPVGYRPLKQSLFPGIQNAIFVRVDVFANGDVKVISNCQNNWLSLDGISFPTF